MSNEMKVLINSHMNLHKARDIFIRTSGTELNKLSEPCYAPSMKKNLYELLKASNFSEQDLKRAVDAYWKGTKQESFYINKDIYSNLIILYMHIFLKQNDKRAFEGAILFYMIRQYANVYHKYFPKYCDPDVFRYALDNMTKTHLFYTQGGIGGALYHLSNEILKRTPKYNFKEILLKYDDKELISKFMQAARHRVNQSMKSFVANVYYPAQEAGNKIGQEKEYDEGNEEEKSRTPQLIDKIADDITIYKIFNSRVFNSAQTASKVDSVIGKKLIKALMNPNHKDQLVLSYTLLIKDLNLQPTQICSSTFFNKFKKLLSIKKSNKSIYYKKTIVNLLNTLVKEIRMKKKFDEFDSVKYFQYITFLSFYTALILRNKICSN